MIEIVKAGGWLMAPIIVCAIIALGIILERFWTLQRKRIIPEDLTSKVWGWVEQDNLDQKRIQTLHQGSALGQVLAAGLVNRNQEREIMKDSIEDTGRHVVHELERYLDTLGTVAAVSPLLGLLGTVIGMVKVFTAITTQGVGDPTVLAGGIAEALITTAAGLTVAIVALIGFRYFRNRVDTLVVEMEKEAIKLVEALHRRRARSGEDVALAHEMLSPERPEMAAARGDHSRSEIVADGAEAADGIGAMTEDAPPAAQHAAPGEGDTESRRAAATARQSSKGDSGADSEPPAERRMPATAGGDDEERGEPA